VQHTVSQDKGIHGSVARRFLLAAFGVLAACTPPDGTPRLSAVLPEVAIRELAPETVLLSAPEEGLTFLRVWSRTGPWAVHLLRVDLRRCELGLQVIPAGSGSPQGGRERVTDLLDRAGPGAVAGVNGDFFTPEGLPVSTEIANGRVRRVGTRPVFAWRPGKDPWVGVAGSEGDSVLLFGWSERRSSPNPGTHVVGGFPLLLRSGARVGDLEVTSRPSFAAARHPRTAVGFDPRRMALWLVEVDGRQPGYSEGMTLPELTQLLESLGATEALNLDGGGSSVMVLGGEAVSRPSDAEGERRVGNALAVLRDPGLCQVGAGPRG
jgi:hypothetical protein